MIKRAKRKYNAGLIYTGKTLQNRIKILMSSKTKHKECVYCGSNEKLTKDHIPPKSLFPQGQRINLVTVPSCEKCNANFSKDDTYFRDMMVLRQDLSKNPIVQELSKTAVRSFGRPESEAYFQKVYAMFGEHEARTRQGIYVGKQPTIEVDLNRIRDVVNRIVKGLFYYERGKTLSSEYIVSTIIKEDMERLNFEESKSFMQAFIIPILESNPKTIGRNVFTYKLAYSNKPNCTIWLLIFYDRVPFISITLPKEKVAKRKAMNSKYPVGFFEV